MFSDKYLKKWYLLPIRRGPRRYFGCPLKRLVHAKRVSLHGATANAHGKIAVRS
jgi:hypothetical protein